MRCHFLASYRAGTKYSLLYCYICVYHSIHDMKTEKVKVTQVAVNAANPRLITEEKFHKLVISLLVFPKMLEYRPVVVDDKLTALGGNMRVKALQHINEMSLDEITQTFDTNKDFQAKTEAEQGQIIEFWQAWKQQPTIPIIKASTLSETEQKEFIIKDNVSFGRWDWDMLANEWETDKLIDWGMDCDFLRNGENIDIDSFFEEINNGDARKNQDVKVEIIIPEEEKDIEESIRNILAEALKDYPNISIK